jgi:uncharacterized coiled-coil protein SlyX
LLWAITPVPISRRATPILTSATPVLLVNLTPFGLAIRGSKWLRLWRGITNAMVAGSPVFIDTTTGQLGLMSSSGRFKDAIERMGKASEVLLSLQPVKFHYKKNIDPKGAPQFGLVAENVEKVDPDLVVRDAEGKAFAVRYEAVNAMLLNEFLKEHRKVQEQDSSISQLKSTAAKQEATIAQQQKQIEALTAGLKEQALQFQKVISRIETSNPTPQVVLTDHN